MSTFAGNPDSAGPGFCPAPPPPPPPPPVPGQVPALRINTVETPVPRRQLPNNNNPYEPPAAIQNAMMTKDKKPFTYTPGMGGKLDLSQIRSPRMARRVAKNANDEGIEGPPKSSLAAEPRPVSAGPNLYAQPQVAVPVFPANLPLQPSANRAPSASTSRVPSNASDRGTEIQRPVARVETKLTPVTQVVSPQQSPPDTPTTPPQVTLAKAPTPWLQNKNKPQEDLPEWAKRASVNRPSSSTSPESPGNNTIQIQPQIQQTIQLQQSAPVPRQQSINQQQQYQQPNPRQQSQPQERVIPLRIEDRPSVFSVKNEPGHHQFKQQQQQQPSPHHQQRWGSATPPQTPVQVQAPIVQNQNQQPRPQSSGGGTYIVPIMVEGSNNNGPATTPYKQPQQVPARSQPVQNQSPRVIVQRGPPSPQIQQQGEPGPVQSRSFRVLQKITDTDAPDDVDGEHLRKLQLTEDDKILMNKFKEQVDGDGTYLHQEEDPRYRGAAIPSRAFRFLQNMTDSGDVSAPTNAPRTPSAINKRQNRNSRSFEESQANLPASEQQVQEPKKYTGSAIPSRSFRILQAMTSPESIAKQENRQAVIICRTESSMQPGNQQQGVFLSSSSSHDSSSLSLAQQSQVPTQIPSSQLHPSQLCLSQMHLSELQSLEMQTPESSQIQPSQNHQLEAQPSEFQESENESPEQRQSYLQLLHLQQIQPSELQGPTPPFWQYPEGNCWWGYYPVQYPNGTSNATASSSSPSQSSPASANNHASIPHNIPPFSYDNYAYCTGYHQQDGNAFAYYHPLYDQRLYAPNAAAISTATGQPSSSPTFSSSSSSSSSFSSPSTSDTAALHQCTDLPSSSSNEKAFAVASSNELLPEASGTCSSRFLLARPTTTILHPVTTACLIPAFIHHQPKKQLPNYDSNCNPCLDTTECGCGGTVMIVRCPPGLAMSPGTSVEGLRDPVVKTTGWVNPEPGNSDSVNSIARSNNEDHRKNSTNNWLKKDHTLTEPEPPPWNQKYFVASPGKSQLMSEQSNEFGWNPDENNDVAENAVIKYSKEDNVEHPEINIETKPINHQNGNNERKWNRIDNASRNVNEIDVSIPMNILHEEKAANESAAVDRIQNDKIAMPLQEVRSSSDHSVDGNDTDLDTESESTSSESSVGAEQACTDPVTNTEEEIDSESESDSDDSDSYLAYSTGLNPHNKITRQSSSNVTLNPIEKEFRKSQTATTVSDDAFDERSFIMSSDRLNSTDCESCPEEDGEMEEQIKLEKDDKNNSGNSKTEDIVPHRLSVILEDGEQNNRGSASPNKIDGDGWQVIPEEPPDNSTTVSVSLPLRLRFSVSENHEDTTTVIIGDGTVKPNDETQPEDSNDVCVSLTISNDSNTSVDFTLKKNCIETTNDEDDSIDFWESITAERKSSDVNLNLKTAGNSIEKFSSNETKVKEEDDWIESSKEEEKSDLVPNEFYTTNKYNEDCEDFWGNITSGRTIPNIISEEKNNTNSTEAENLEKTNKCNEDDGIDFWATQITSSDRDTPEVNFYLKREKSRVATFSSNEVELKEETSPSEAKSKEKITILPIADVKKTSEMEMEIDEKSNLDAMEENGNPSHRVDDKKCVEDDSEDEELEIDECPHKETMHMSEKIDEEVSMMNATTPLFELTEAKTEDNDNEEDQEEIMSGGSHIENSKHLLSVQNSRDETDDEDSGVTSDMSRLISEVDTDSECGQTRKINNYKRTQTHSRLFRLLSREDDGQSNGETRTSARRDRLTLPLKKSGFSYDESHHCSNYSSGVTSPDFSPVYEGSTWRRVDGEENRIGAVSMTPGNPLNPATLVNDEEFCKASKDRYFENWKKNSNVEEKILEDKIVPSNAFKIFENGTSGLPNWRFRTNVLCPRIKSSKNVPRSLRQSRPAKPVISSPATSSCVMQNNEKLVPPCGTKYERC